MIPFLHFSVPISHRTFASTPGVVLTISSPIMQKPSVGARVTHAHRFSRPLATLQTSSPWNVFTSAIPRLPLSRLVTLVLRNPFATTHSENCLPMCVPGTAKRCFGYGRDIPNGPGDPISSFAATEGITCSSLYRVNFIPVAFPPPGDPK